MSNTELSENLLNYELQLLQVEAALTSEPENEELLKLKNDLDEVINLTKELLQNGDGSTSSSKKTRKWVVGNKCLALWDQDKQYYEAVIDQISENDECHVTFSNYGHSDVVRVSTLKPIEKRTASMAAMSEPGSSKKRLMNIEQKEQKKKKQQKKKEKMKIIEEEREEEKSKWQQFNAKAFNKNKKGHVKKSIFASPESVSGRVGVGTCGIGGKPMTDYQQQEKYKKSLH